MCDKTYCFTLMVDQIYESLEDEMKKKNIYLEEDIWMLID